MDKRVPTRRKDTICNTEMDQMAVAADEMIQKL